jgi:membrane protease YdiL (CAAX protease family)
MEDKVYPSFVQGLVLSISLILLLVISYALESIPLHLNIKVPDFYVSTASAFSSFLYIPIIFYALKKSKINILNNLRFPNFKICGMLILLAVSFRILTFPLSTPIEFSHFFLNGRMEYFKFKPLVFDINFIIKFIQGFILAPVFEEIFFRGILLQQFLKRYSPSKAILLSGLLFVFAHFRLLDAGALIVYGIIFGYVFYKTNSIVASILVHSVGNLIAQFTKNYATSMDDSSLLKLFFLLIASILVVYFFVKHIDRFQNKHADNIIIDN